MSFKHDYVKQLCAIGGYTDHIGQAAIYFYHSDIPLDDAKRYIKNLKQTLERTKDVGNIRPMEKARPIRTQR
jgi:hypothetical protein